MGSDDGPPRGEPVGGDRARPHFARRRALVDSARASPPAWPRDAPGRHALPRPRAGWRGPSPRGDARRGRLPRDRRRRSPTPPSPPWSSSSAIPTCVHGSGAAAAGADACRQGMATIQIGNGAAPALDPLGVRPALVRAFAGYESVILALARGRRGRVPPAGHARALVFVLGWGAFFMTNGGEHTGTLALAVLLALPAGFAVERRGALAAAPDRRGRAPAPPARPGAAPRRDGPAPARDTRAAAGAARRAARGRPGGHRRLRPDRRADAAAAPAPRQPARPLRARGLPRRPAPWRERPAGRSAATPWRFKSTPAPTSRGGRGSERQMASAGAMMRTRSRRPSPARRRGAVRLVSPRACAAAERAAARPPP